MYPTPFLESSHITPTSFPLEIITHVNHVSTPTLALPLMSFLLRHHLCKITTALPTFATGSNLDARNVSTGTVVLDDVITVPGTPAVTAGESAEKQDEMPRLRRVWVMVLGSGFVVLFMEEVMVERLDDDNEEAKPGI